MRTGVASLALAVWMVGPLAALSTSAPMDRALGTRSQDGDFASVGAAMAGLVNRDRTLQARAARYLQARGERDAIPPMLDALRYQQFTNPYLLAALRQLAGVDLGRDYRPWVDWMTRERIEGPPGYRAWKAEFLGRLDPQFSEFLDPGRPSTIAYEEVQWGGVRVDGIPSLDDPRTMAADEATYLTDEELVFGVALEGESGGVTARAYPLRVLDWHEMTNDTVDGLPVALSYCTLCGSGILFDRRVAGRVLTFATSGLLYRSNKLMYDRETTSLWSNLTGKPVIGPLVEEGLQLAVLPIVVTEWGEWRRQHPDTSVLDIDTGYDREYEPGQPYGDYFASPDTIFPIGLEDDRLARKAWVFGVEVGSQRMAFALDALHERGILNTVVGGVSIVLVPGSGRAVRAYERGERIFSLSDGELVADDGTAWRLTDLGLLQRDAPTRLPRVPGHLAYWFGWYAFFPDTGLWTGAGSQ